MPKNYDMMLNLTIRFSAGSDWEAQQRAKQIVREIRDAHQVTEFVDYTPAPVEPAHHARRHKRAA